jgi:hypothetical protein
MINIGTYSKTVIAAVTGLIGWAALVVASEQSSVSAEEWLAGATALATALGVYAVSNEVSPSE